MSDTLQNALTDKETNLHMLKEKVRQFCEEREWDQFHGPKDLAIGLSTEAAELLEHFRFQSDADIDRLMQDQKSRLEIGYELADCLFFILRFAGRNNLDLARLLHLKMNLSAERYPVEKARGSNKKYSSLS